MIRHLIFLLQLLFIMIIGSRRAQPSILHPVLLIPGDGGSQLEAMLTGKPDVVHYWCYKKTDNYFDLWLNLELFLPEVIDCWIDNMKLVYNTSTNTTSNMPGVLTKVPDFGNTSSLEWLDKSKAKEGEYFIDIANVLTGIGYKRGKSLVGAPYDWRKAPNEYNEYFENLTTVIENTYKYNGNKKLVVIAHSMGNPVMLYFYNNFVSPEWKSKFIHSHISIAGAWGGALQVVRLLASGYNMNHYRILLPPSKLRAMQRSFTSSAFLFPSYNVWDTKEVFATVGDRNYSLSNVEEFFNDINYKVGWSQYQNTGFLLGKLEAPNVEVHCIYGYGIETPEKFVWTHFWFPDYQPTTAYGDGDGTVNLQSLEACKKWDGKNGDKKIFAYPLKYGEHLDILQRNETFEIILSVVLEQF